MSGEIADLFPSLQICFEIFSTAWKRRAFFATVWLEGYEI